MSENVNKKSSIAEYLEKNGSLTYSNKGVSMLPLLRQNRDLFTLSKKTLRRCRKGDVVLYRRPPDKYVLHRVIEVRAEDYVILGDNCINKEYGITDNDILGVMTSFSREGKEHSVRELPYRIYTFIILNTIPVRTAAKKFVFRTKTFVKRLLHYEK